MEEKDKIQPKNTDFQSMQPQKEELSKAGEESKEVKMSDSTVLPNEGNSKVDASSSVLQQENEKVSEEKAKEQESKPAFITYGGNVEILEDENIAYYKTRYRFLTTMFKLVGRFDSKGRYVVSEEIKKELLKMYKEIKSSNEQEYKAETSFFGKIFYFTVTITKASEDKSKASLYLEEFVGQTLGEQWLKTKIADYVDLDNDEFRIKVRQVFNLTDIAPVIKEFEVPNIAVAFQNALDIDLVVGELFDVASQGFLVRLIKELEESKVGQEIIAKYKSLLDGSENQYERKYIYLRMLLERVIDEYGGYEILGLDKKKKSKLVQDLLLSIQNLKKKAKDNVGGVVEVKKEPAKKPENKPSSNVKKPAKKEKKEKDKKEKKEKKKEKKKSAKANKSKTEPIVFYVDEKPAKESSKPEEIESVSMGNKPEIKPSVVPVFEPVEHKQEENLIDLALNLDVEIEDVAIKNSKGKVAGDSSKEEDITIDTSNPSKESETHEPEIPVEEQQDEMEIELERE